MSAKDRLRAYLEQRRELGESEMTLDALDVDDVMRMLGALQGESGTSEPASRAKTPSSAPGAAPKGDAPVSAQADPPDRPTAQAAPETANEQNRGADWQSMMERLKGAAPQRPDVSPSPPNLAPGAGAVPVDPPRANILRLAEGVVFPIGLRVDRPIGRVNERGAEWASLADIHAAIAECQGCGLARTATNAVPGAGNPRAEVLVVGEAPGEQEDLRGEPFVGPAGELLTKILGAIELTRDAVYICNVLKHRPPGNRNPMPDEIRACAPFLQRQVDLIQPKLILALGTFAAQSLLGTKLAIGKLRQQLHWYQGIPLIATYHPAALLRNDAWKRPTWEDVKLARRVLDATLRT